MAAAIGIGSSIIAAIGTGSCTGTAIGGGGAGAATGATDARSDLHCSQNSAPSSLSNWQNGHFTMMDRTSNGVCVRQGGQPDCPCVCLFPSTTSSRLDGV